MKIITTKRLAQVEGTGVIIGDLVETLNTEHREITQDSITEDIQKVAKEVSEFNGQQVNLAYRIHKNNPNPFTIEQKAIEQ